MKKLLLFLLLLGVSPLWADAENCIKAEDCDFRFMRSVKHSAKEASNFVMEHGGISLLETLSGTSKGNHFCGGEGEPPAGCSLEDALKHYEASPENATFLREFVGAVDKRHKDGKKHSGTGFIVRTERCAGNNLVFMNAHAIFNWKTDGKRKAKSAKFCLNGACYELDLNAISKMENHGLLGARKRPGKGARYRYLDYVVLPIKGKKRPAPKEAARLGAFSKFDDTREDMLFAGYHIKKERVRFVQGCKITHALDGYPLTLFHNCPGEQGFSGGPLINDKAEIVALHTGSKRQYNGQAYDPRNNRFNSAAGISQDLIDNLNRYCSDSN